MSEIKTLKAEKAKHTQDLDFLNGAYQLLSGGVLHWSVYFEKMHQQTSAQRLVNLHFDRHNSFVQQLEYALYNPVEKPEEFTDKYKKSCIASYRKFMKHYLTHEMKKTYYSKKISVLFLLKKSKRVKE